MALKRLERMSSFLYLILPALGGYTLTSLYLLKNPLLLHKRKRVAFHSEHISHRGGECGRCRTSNGRTGVLDLI